MKHVTFNADITNTVRARNDLATLTAWFTAHDIDVAFLRITQKVDYTKGHVWYDQYRHTSKGVLIHEKATPELFSTVPVVDREHHRCTAACKDVEEPVLSYYTIEETDEPAPGSKPRRRAG